MVVVVVVVMAGMSHISVMPVSSRTRFFWFEKSLLKSYTRIPVIFDKYLCASVANTNIL